jgi:3-oxoacyl-[acyl-carrier-protein] synthase II
MISSLGTSCNEMLESFKKKKKMFVRPFYDPDVAVAPVEKFNLKEYTGRFKDARYLHRGAGLSLAAAVAAYDKSGLTPGRIENAGLFTGAGPNFDIGNEINEIKEGAISESNLKALWILKFLPNTSSSAIAKFLGIHGENTTTGSACAASLAALGEAFRKIKDGYLDIAFAGGGDSRLNPGGILAYKKANALWSGDGAPEESYIPFSGRSNGFIPGEGGAFFILESLEHAMARDAEIVAEIKGFGSSMDGYNMTAPEPEGRYAENAVRNALKEAAKKPGDIDVISTHGTGTPLNDAMEAALLKRIFEDKLPKIVALKGWIGHLSAACGAVELSVMLSCMKNEFIPGVETDQVMNGLPCVMRHEKTSFDTMLLENFGFGGQNCALVVTKWKN